MNDVEQQFEGLSLPELLELMHPPWMPEPVSWLPVTDGWWVLVAWLLALAGVGALHWRRQRRRNRYRREALAALDALAGEAAGDPAASAAAVAAIVRRAALAVWPRRQVAGIYGSEWAAFLTQTAANDPEVAAGAEALARAAWDPAADGAALLAPARRWVKVHRA